MYHLFPLFLSFTFPWKHSFQKVVHTLYFTRGLLATIVSGQNWPVQISPVSSESGSCKSYSTTTNLTEIKEAIRSQVNAVIMGHFVTVTEVAGLK